MVKPGNTKKRKKIDWESIAKEYRAGQLSNVEIGKNYGVTEGAIRKRAKKDGWQKLLANQVRVRIQEKLVRDSVRLPNTSDEEIVEETAERGANIIKLHRRDISKSQGLVTLFQDQLQEAAISRDDVEETISNETRNEEGKIDVKRRNAMMRAVSLPAHAGVLRDLSVAQKNLVYLERQAYSISDDSGGDDADLTITLKARMNTKKLAGVIGIAMEGE